MVKKIRRSSRNLAVHHHAHNSKSLVSVLSHINQSTLPYPISVTASSLLSCHMGRYSDLLRPGRSGDRMLVEATFSAPVQTGPGAYPASCTMGTGSFPGVKRPGRGVDHTPPSSTEVKERVELYLYSHSGTSWPVLGRTLHLMSFCSLYLKSPNKSNGFLDFVHRLG
jgi:hypothetical protein